MSKSRNEILQGGFGEVHKSQALAPGRYRFRIEGFAFDEAKNERKSLFCELRFRATQVHAGNMTDEQLAYTYPLRQKFFLNEEPGPSGKSAKQLTGEWFMNKVGIEFDETTSIPTVAEASVGQEVEGLVEHTPIPGKDEPRVEVKRWFKVRQD